MLKDIITADQLSLVISQAAAPAFLLGAVASFLSVLVSHMSRIIDRSRAIHAIADGDPMKAQLPVLRFRATLIIRAIHWAVGSGISTCILMIVAFITLLTLAPGLSRPLPFCSPCRSACLRLR